MILLPGCGFDQLTNTPTLMSTNILVSTNTPTVTATTIPTTTPIPTNTAIPAASATVENRHVSVILFGDSITKQQILFGNPLGTELVKNLPDKLINFTTMGYSCQRINSDPIWGCAGLKYIPAPLAVYKQEILPANPDYLLLFFGMNIKADSDIHDQIMIYEKIAKQMPDTTVVILTPIHNCSNQVHDKLLDKLADTEFSLAEKIKINLIDVRSYLGNTLDACKLYYSNDLVHLSRPGQEYISQFIAMELTETMKEK